jgi:cytochrome c553
MRETVRVGWIACTAAAIALAQAQAAAPTAPAAAAASPAPAAAQAAAPAAAPASPFTTGKAASGEGKAALCSACHGPQGNSANPEWPRLAGQSAVYLAEQLRLFRSGVRDNPIMKPLAAALSDQDISDLAVYYEAQTPTGLEADPSYWKAGEAVYVSGDGARNVPACVACHGPVGRGNLAAGYPALRAQQSVYVVKQLNDYASGARYPGPHPEQASRNGTMMLTLAKRLTPEEIRDVASYVQGMR